MKNLKTIVATILLALFIIGACSLAYHKGFRDGYQYMQERF